MNKKHKLILTDSPCVRNCCLDSEDICLGCFRHIDEIIAWRSFSEQDKQQVIVLCQHRQNEHNNKI
ncbi:DUF1289 domain-containing protein [Colwellia piezophila]|uniref:DUF1289 domain-containing protein n=1 Tax=Colwellia piezophila TaxID=211668 RepID=UPI0009FD50BB|nr:DUF1289 domain-containing protein [Colwellia piezophila]